MTNTPETATATAAGTAPVVRLWCAVLAGYLALGATLQALPGYVEREFAGGPVLSGIAVGIAFLATALVRPVAGLLADTRNARPVVVSGGLLTALGALGHLLAPNVAVLIVARLVMGAGEAALFSAALPWVMRATPPERSGRVAGWFGLSMWGGLAAGPLVASTILAVSEFSTVWGVVLGLGLLAAAFALSTGSPSAPRQAVTITLRTLVKLVPRAALAPGLSFGLSSFGYGTIVALVVLLLSSRGQPASSYALAVFAVVFLLVRALCSPLVDRYGGAPVGQAAVLLAVVGLGVIAVSDTAAVTVVGVGVAGAGIALTYPATVSMTLRRTEGSSLGTSVGVMISFWDLGIMVAGPLSGLVAEQISYQAAFSLAAVLGLVSILVIELRIRRPRAAARAELVGEV